jgi:hypothetical protein
MGRKFLKIKAIVVMMSGEEDPVPIYTILSIKFYPAKV